MAQYIPEGGNWKNIPEEITDSRLASIRETGGRTTYYGRLRWDKPSYTINTFFNRVPNGCNLHPSQMRVISIREAARFQSFPDDYIFVGKKVSIYKQIGNAVPPLLARFISTLLKPHLDSYNIIDLFAGCGGLSEGFIQNGFRLLAANEFDSAVFGTNIVNHTKYIDSDKFILGDVTKQKTKDSIYSACGGEQVDVILGGPPCQGFSYAGLRDPKDKRNQLFRDFVDIVTTLQPKFFVMENVPGILTMRQGQAIREIIQAFADAGYYVGQPLKLTASDFGVPQKRKRVVLIGCRENITIQQPSPLFAETSNFIFKLPKHITVKEAIGSFPEIEDGGGEEEMVFSIKNPSAYDRLMAREISFDEFYAIKQAEV
jgi:DNA (cytosine-5)-methyltransferase 1